jgi:peptidase M23-like protein/putative serine esterase DUF676
MHRQRRNVGSRRFPVLPGLVSLVLTAPATQAAVAAQVADIVLQPPAGGRVVRGFEEPIGRFDAGHRGLDIALPLGTPVRAAADGTVAFAGVVAGSLFVTVDHGAPFGRGRLETTYSFLSRIDVRSGSAVRAGDVIGASGAGHPGSNVPALHFGVRSGGRYVDPAPLLRLPRAGRDDVSDLVSLGPLPEPELLDRHPGPATRSSPPARRRPAGGAGPAGGTTQVGSAGSARESGPAGGIHAAAAPRSLGVAPVAARQPQCSEAGTAAVPRLPTAADLRAGVRPPAAPDDDVVIAVAGIGSSTWARPDGSMASDAAMYQLDLRTLGYAADRIFHFSYRGIPAAGQPRGGAPYQFQLPYGSPDTFRPIAESAALLQQLVERIHADDPARHIDLVAHSQGGVVAQYYLERLYDPARPGGPVVDHLVTIASPHLGADLAGFGARLGAAGATQPVLDRMERLARALGAPPPGSPAFRDLAFGSPTMDDLARGWTGVVNAGAVRTTTIAAGLDLVVPAQRTRLPGVSHYTVDVPGPGGSLWTAHAAIVRATATKQILYGALSDHPAPCTTLQDAIADSVVGPLVSAIENRFLDVLAGAAAPSPRGPTQPRQAAAPPTSGSSGPEP